MANFSSGYLQFYILVSLICFSNFSIAADTISPTQSIKDGDTIVSATERFELGFFSPENSKNRYVGIWYKQVLPVQTVVWVANRNNPITDSSGVLKVVQERNLVILNGPATVVWSSSNQSSKGGNRIVAQLLDSGNLVIREELDDDPEKFLWQSFDYPTDTLLPGMKLGFNFKTGINRTLTSWRNSDDPAVGDYSYNLDLQGLGDPTITKRSIKQFRCGPWDGVRFNGAPEMKPNDIFNFNYITSDEEIYYSFALRNESVLSRMVMSQSGLLNRFTWRIKTSQSWNLYWYSPRDQCDKYMECGDYGVCDTDSSPVCKCVRGFEPKVPQTWFLRNGSDGCVQKTKYECQKDDGFLKMGNMKVPDGAPGSFMDSKMSLKECEAKCRRDCSCKAYANSNVLNGGSGCWIWFDVLVDLRHYGEGGQDLYVRVAASELDKGGGSAVSKMLIIIFTVIAGVVLLGLSCYFMWKKEVIKGIGGKKPKERVHNKEINSYKLPLQLSRDHSDESSDDLELPLFDLNTLTVATLNFSDVNKLGEGGFGSVYKGTLSDGKEIAVKRLSKTSVQGSNEFRNEVKLIARLQHRNLVRLLGCCAEGNETTLVYEYMENRSLDCKLFDKTRGSLLDWRTRFNIISGIARGLLYLHQDSRLRIIHRDLKASNVLLDGDMNPKISDFGMARIFGGEQTEGNTRRVVGTYGYMSPEYAMDGLFSIKSDVFSFGVLVLEIISGKKNRGFYSKDHYNLLSYAWKLWNEGRSFELMDETIRQPCPTAEVLRSMQVGMLCVQERAEDRPTMSSVVLMLSSETAIAPQPKQPGFCLVDVASKRNSSGETESQESCSNEVTVTLLQPR